MNRLAVAVGVHGEEKHRGTENLDGGGYTAKLTPYKSTQTAVRPPHDHVLVQVDYDGHIGGELEVRGIYPPVRRCWKGGVGRADLEPNQDEGDTYHFRHGHGGRHLHLWLH
jgi:hypothetical protein